MEESKRRKLFRVLMDAIKGGNTELVFSTFKSNPEAIHMESPLGSWINIAAEHGQLEIVERLLEIGIDINHPSGFNKVTALHSAAREGRIEIMKFLLKNGANLDVSDPNRNPLFVAITRGHMEVVETLIAAGIDLAIKYDGDFDALEHARIRGATEIYELLSGKPFPDRKTLTPIDLVKELEETAWTSVRKMQSNYSLCFCLTEESGSVWMAASSEAEFESRKRKFLDDSKLLEFLRKNQIDIKKALLGDYRWSAYEWQRQDMKTFEQWPGLISDDIGQSLSEAVATLVVVLKNLRDSKRFASIPGSELMTLFVSVPNSLATHWIERESARLLNEPAVFDAFLRERISYIETKDASETPEDFFTSIAESGLF